MNKTKNLMEETILLATDALSRRIQDYGSEEDNMIDAKSIKILAEAYCIVRRGRYASVHRERMRKAGEYEGE